jgi:hypothetical protein
MAMKNGRLLLLSAGLASLAVLSACTEKEILDPVLNEVGSPITFGASTEWQNAAGTRTEYSGKDENGLDISAGSEYERIDWVDGEDLIRILCDAAVGKSDAGKKTADYIVTDVAVGSEKQTSTAGITPADNNSLHWGEGKHYFYALYPAPGMESNYAFTYKTVTEAKSKIESFTGNRARITAELPSEQEVVKVGKEYKANMNYAYMYASTTAEPGGTGSVVLGFKPLVTTFEIRLIAADAQAVGMKLKQVKLTSETGAAGSDLTGRFVARLNTDGTYTVTSKSSEGRSIVVPIAASAQQALATNSPLKITLLALPEDQTGLTLTLTFDKNGEEVQRKLPLRADLNEDGKIGTSEWIKVGAGKKIYISNLGVPGDVWHYTIEDVEDIIINGRAAGSGTSAIKTYRSSGSTKEYVDVTFQYSTNGTTFSDGLPSGLTSLSKNTGSEAVERKLTARVGAHENIESVTDRHEIIEHARIMATRASKGTTASPYDLSTHTVTGEERPSDQPVVTANSYIVNAPGTYMFPLVYGNAIDATRVSSIDATAVNGGNRGAYQSTSAESPRTAYKRFDGATIKRPYILWDIANGGVTPEGTSVGEHDNNFLWSNYELVVVWQDVPTSEAIITQPVTYSQSANNALGNCVIYAVFTVDPTVINEAAKTVKGAHQGNIVIALRTKKAIKVGDTTWPIGTIIWSWHIWVTDNDMTPIPVKTNGSTVKSSNNMLPYHLGWCDEKVFTNTRYQTRTWYVKATQKQKNPSDAEYQSKVFKVIQKGDDVTEIVRYSAATCYQWGRKDPLLPGYNTYTKQSFSGGGGGDSDFRSFNKAWSSPSGYNIVGAEEGYLLVSDNAMDVDELIRLPYIYNRYGVNYRNLWNRSATDTFGADVAVRKTIYDPCPPGYSIPHMHAFSNFYKDGTAAIVNGVHDLDQINAKDVDGDGAITREDYWQDDGWYFYTGYGDNTIFFGGTTGRLSNVSLVQYYHEGYIWTAARDWRDESSPAGKQNGGFDFHYTPTCAFPWISATNHALTVHPVAGN